MSNHVQREHPVIKGGFGRLTLSSRIAGDCVWLNSIRLKLERGCTNLTSRCRPADLLCYRNLCRVSVHSLQNCWQGVLVFFCARTMNGLRAKSLDFATLLIRITTQILSQLFPSLIVSIHLTPSYSLERIRDQDWLPEALNSHLAIRSLQTWLLLVGVSELLVFRVIFSQARLRSLPST